MNQFSKPFQAGMLLLFLGVLLLLFRIDGIHLDKEAEKYLGCAGEVLHGNFSGLTGPYKGFITYILFLVPFVATGMPVLAIFVQAGISFYAAFSLGNIVRELGGSQRVQQAAVILFLVTIPLQQWVLSLYTESFFTSLVVLMVEKTLQAGKSGRSHYLLLLAVLFARPVGMLFALPAWIWGWINQQRPGMLAIAFASVLLLAICIPGIPRAQLTPIVEAHVICGFSGDPGAMDTFRGSSILDAQLFLLKRHGWSETAALFFRRAGSLFVITKPYFSERHNKMLAPFYLLYPLALIGMYRIRKRPAAGLLIGLLVLNVMLVGLTHDEWNSRFLVPLWPLLILFACANWLPIKTDPFEKTITK